MIIGPRSVGKTTVGRILAKKIEVRYFDFDKIVDKKLKGIDEHILKYGADSYRKKEGKILKNFLKGLPKKYLISLGGGTIASQLEDISKKNLTNIKEKGHLIYLSSSKNIKESVKILYQREKKRKGNKDIKETIKLFKIRKPIYEKAFDLKIIVNKKSPLQICNEIIKKLK